MSNSPLSIATLVGSRICHDLISPVGAIHNGIELIGMAGPVDTPELTLISDSVTNAAARIKFFRIAFGTASGAQMIGAPEVAKTARDAFAGGRYMVDWQAPGDLPRDVVQAAYLAILCLESALPVGGDITVRRDANDHLTLFGTGARVSCDPALWTPLSEGRTPVELRPAHVQFALLGFALAALARDLAISMADDSVSLTF